MKRKYIILLHLVFWGLLILNNSFAFFNNNAFDSFRNQPKSFSLFVKCLFCEVGFSSITALCFYSNYLFVAPALFLKKNYFKAVLFVVLTLTVLISWRYIVEFWFFKPVLGFDNYKGNSITAEYYINNIFYYYFPVYFVYGIMYFFVESWYQSKQRQQEFEKEQATAELSFLRSQINPHFLFNSINDIYSLTYKRSDLAPVALLKLSEILRYMLREGKGELMLLQDEIKYLENVIELQHISAKGKANIEFCIEGYIGDQKIATLLFIAFTENAFKHGLLTDPKNPIKIRLKATDRNIQFTIQNKKSIDQKDKTGGIGLNNVRRRLLLIYPDKHSLIITDNTDFYTVNLTLQLS